MAVVARALSDRRSDERRAHGCHSALLKGEVRDLTAWLDGPGIHRFFNGEHGSKRAFRRFKPPGKRSRARRKEDQRQQSAIRAALEMRAGQSGASASNVEALRESSDLNPL